MSATIHMISSTVELMKMQCRMCPDAATDEILMRAEDRHTKSITVCKSINPGSLIMISASMSATIQTIQSIVELMKMQCRMCPDAATDEILMRAEDRHTKSIIVCKSINTGSRQLIVAYDIGEHVCNDSYDL